MNIQQNGAGVLMQSRRYAIANSYPFNSNLVSYLVKLAICQYHTASFCWMFERDKKLLKRLLVVM